MEDTNWLYLNTGVRVRRSVSYNIKYFSITSIECKMVCLYRTLENSLRQNVLPVGRMITKIIFSTKDLLSWWIEMWNRT